MSSFTKGMVVQLVSGGPKMSVGDIGDYSGSGGPVDGVKCMWFDAKNVRHEELFDAAILKAYVASPVAVSLRRG